VATQRQPKSEEDTILIPSQTIEVPE
jgi:hypothetical protein